MKLQTRFILLLLFIFLSVSGIVVLQRYFDVQRSQSLLSSELKSRKTLLSQDLASEGKTFEALQTDYSFWDNMVSLAQDNPKSINTTNADFAHQNIDTALPTFGADIAWVYNTKGQLVYSAKQDTTFALNTIPISKAYFMNLDSHKFLHYYVQTAQGTMEIRSATIVPSNDPNHNDSASGYWIVGRLLGNTFLSSINDLSQSTNQLIGTSVNHADSRTADSVTFSSALQNWDGSTVQYLSSSTKVSSIDELNSLYKKELLVVGLLGLGLVMIISFTLWLIILKPLQMITNSVKNQDPRSIDIMATTKTQFGDLAATIQGFFEQKEQLEKISSDMDNANKELQAKDSVKDDFISMLSHQLGTPLSAMEGFLTLIVQGFYGEANEKIMAAVQKTLTRTKNMKALVFDLLNVSRMTAGQFVIERSEVNLNNMVKDQVDELSVAANEKNISLTYHEPEKPLPMLQLDEAKTRQVILNLVNNAIFYTPKNGEVHVYLSQTDTEVEFKVLDNGIGVPDEAKDKLFTKFFRADNAKELSPHGTGIGLYLVKRVIDDQDGKTFFSSEAGKGSIFGFRLPLSNDKNPVPSASQEEKTTSDTKIEIKDLTTDSKE